MSPSLRDPPTRPSLPVLFLAAIVAWACMLLAEQITWTHFAQTLASPGCVPFIVLCVLAALGVVTWNIAARKLPKATRRAPFATIAIVLVSAAASLACGFMFWTGWAHDVESLSDLFEREGPVHVDLTGDPATSGFSTTSYAELEVNGHMAKVRLEWPEETEPLSSGHRVAVTGTVRVVEADDSGRWSHQNGYVATIRGIDIEDVGRSPNLRGAVCAFRDASFENISSLGGDAAGLLAGILLGNRTLYRGTELELAFQTTGLAHLMAVSGTHLAIVTMLVSVVLGATPLKRHFRSVLIVGALVAYAALTGFAASALRACTMCTAALLAGTLKRRSHALAALSLCAFCFLGLSPPIAFSMGFQLSVLAVMGLVLFGSLAQHWISRMFPKLPTVIGSSVAATLAASFITLPITVPAFAQLPLISPLSNLVAAPLVTAALCIGVIALVVGAVITPAGTLLLEAAGAIASCCAALVRLLADVPGACLPVSSASGAIAIFFAVLAIGLWIIWPLPRDATADMRRPSPIRCLKPLAGTRAVFTLPIILVLMLGFGLSAYDSTGSQSRIVMLDVGQGDSMLVQSKDAAILIDTGEKSDVLVRELAERGVSRLDAVVITHKDADHCGALKKLAGIIDIGHVYVHADLLGRDFMRELLEAASWVTDGRGAEGLRPGMSLAVGEFTLTLLAPDDGGRSENDDSLITLLEYDEGRDGSIEARGLLTGDAESDALETALNAAGDIDFLKVAHHGSKGGASAEQLACLKPEVALIGVGANNRYGHPTKETLQLLEQAGTRIYRTDMQGAIAIGFSSQGMSITTERSESW